MPSFQKLSASESELLFFGETWVFADVIGFSDILPKTRKSIEETQFWKMSTLIVDFTKN